MYRAGHSTRCAGKPGYTGQRCQVAAYAARPARQARRVPTLRELRQNGGSGTVPGQPSAGPVYKQACGGTAAGHRGQGGQAQSATPACAARRGASPGASLDIHISSGGGRAYKRVPLGPGGAGTAQTCSEQPAAEAARRGASQAGDWGRTKGLAGSPVHTLTGARPHLHVHARRQGMIGRALPVRQRRQHSALPSKASLLLGKVSCPSAD